MRELHIRDITRMSTLCHRYDVIYAGAERMWELEAEVDWFPTNPTHFLRFIDFLLVAVELRPLGAVMIWA
jgi:hypothetical protein